MGDGSCTTTIPFFSGTKVKGKGTKIRLSGAKSWPMGGRACFELCPQGMKLVRVGGKCGAQPLLQDGTTPLTMETNYDAAAYLHLTCACTEGLTSGEAGEKSPQAMEELQGLPLCLVTAADDRHILGDVTLSTISDLQRSAIPFGDVTWQGADQIEATSRGPLHCGTATLCGKGSSRRADKCNFEGLLKIICTIAICQQRGHRCAGGDSNNIWCYMYVNRGSAH
ncbi:hypothetical protein NDU88_001752 [Pleurodeles waltl]|uniref:Uncharacterized protein n=1 Tax=Pleurodeles waltl TaxID=8319 RepID=A0AAV7R9Z4_PLEWA|nr:hypothetical protein NDU88_001752 [Pleurodeles waltl]